MVEASVIDPPLRPKAKTNNKGTKDRTEEEVSVKKQYAGGVNKDGK